MGIYYSGGMIVGAAGSELSIPEDQEDWEDLGITSMSKYYDASEDDCYWGFEIPDVLASDIDPEWVINILKMGAKFKAITGVEASLIGTQDIS